MKSVNANRNIYRFKNKFSLFFSEYKVYLISCTMLIILGVAFGVFTAVKYSSEITLGNISDANLIELLKGNRGTMGLFFPYLISFCLYCCVIIFLNFKPFMCVFTYLVLLIRGYLIAFDITILIFLYGFAGILNVFLIILPCEILIWLVLIVLAAMSLKRNKLIKKYGLVSCNKNFTLNYKRMVWVLIIIGCLILLLKCLLMPLIRVTIIVKT